MSKVATIACGLLVAGVACGGDDSESGARTESSRATIVGSSSQPTTVPPEFTWVAVYEIEPYSEERRTTFIEDADPFMFDGPAACFDHLTEELGRGQVDILAIVASSEDELRTAQAHVEGDPILIGRYGDRCNH